MCTLLPQTKMGEKQKRGPCTGRPGSRYRVGREDAWTHDEGLARPVAVVSRVEKGEEWTGDGLTR